VKEIVNVLKRERGMEKAVIVATGGYGGLTRRRSRQSST